jgi:hypothetical protein
LFPSENPSQLSRQSRNLEIKTMKFKILLSTLTIASIVLLGGCKKDDFVKIDSECPIVVFTSPVNGETGVLFNKTVSATFNEDLDPASITTASFTLSDGSPVSGAVSYSNRTAYFNPTNLLQVNTTYVATLTSLVKDPFGNTLQTKYIWSFSTGATVSPVVISTEPLNNEVNVVLNKRITATFNMPMNGASINTSTFRLRNGTTAVNGTVSFQDSTASFVPLTPLLPNTTYVATITDGALNLDGNSVVNDYSWDFTTGVTTAPSVIATDPASNEVDVNLNQMVTVTFSEPMDASTLDTTTFTLTSGVTRVAGTVTYAGTTASFTPDANLYSNTIYTVRVTTGVKNPSGTPIANEYVWTFNTVGHLGPQFVDLASVARFGIIAGAGVSNVGFSEIHDMDVGISPGVRSSVTGFPPAIVVNGAIYASDDLLPAGTAAMLVEAKQDLTNAYLFAEGASSPAPFTVAGDLGGITLTPGIYKSTSTLLIQSGDLTLDAQGDINAVWIFQVASDFTTIGGAGGNVILTAGAQAKNIFWQTGSSATIGLSTQFKGNVLALTSITMNSGATVEGRMLARNGSVVINDTDIIRP